MSGSTTRAARRRRTRGAAAIFTVIAMSTVVGAFVLASASTIAPFAREVRRAAASDQALTFADAGALLAQAALAHDPTWAGVVDLPLERGLVTLRVERSGEGFVVTSTASADGSLVGGPGTRITRSIRATLRASTPGGALQVVGWEER